MASPVNTTVKHFTSAMAGAPVLNGTAGSLIALLDAVLVNGFGTKSVTSLVVAGGIATMTFAGGASAALQDSVILVSGATPANLNGEQKVLSANSTTVTFATAETDQTATGTISFKLAGAGWTKPYSGTNLAAYKIVDPTGTGCLLRVDDTSTTHARVIGYETMSDVNTGTGPFPTAAQQSGGGYWLKSATAIAGAVNWIVCADARMFMIFIAPASNANATHIGGVTRGFGDFQHFRTAGDAYACFLSYQLTNAVTSSATENTLDRGGTQVTARQYSGLGSAVLGSLYGYISTAAGSLSGADTFLGVFPTVVDGGLRLTKRFFADSTVLRGELPGLYSVPQSELSATFAWGDRTPGDGPLAGRRLIALTPTNTTPGTTPSVTSVGVSFVDITGPWR